MADLGWAPGRNIQRTHHLRRNLPENRRPFSGIMTWQRSSFGNWLLVPPVWPTTLPGQTNVRDSLGGLGSVEFAFQKRVSLSPALSPSAVLETAALLARGVRRALSDALPTVIQQDCFEILGRVPLAFDVLRREVMMRRGFLLRCEDVLLDSFAECDPSLRTSRRSGGFAFYMTFLTVLIMVSYKLKIDPKQIIFFQISI